MISIYRHVHEQIRLQGTETGRLEGGGRLQVALILYQLVVLRPVRAVSLLVELVGEREGQHHEQHEHGHNDADEPLKGDQLAADRHFGRRERRRHVVDQLGDVLVPEGDVLVPVVPLRLPRNGHPQLLGVVEIQVPVPAGLVRGPRPVVEEIWISKRGRLSTVPLKTHW